MAVVKEVISEPTFLVEMTQSEVDVLAGLASDLTDHRSVYMVYPLDGDNSRPNETGYKVLKGFAQALASTMGPEYDYFDYWETVPSTEVDDIKANGFAADKLW